MLLTSNCKLAIQEREATGEKSRRKLRDFPWRIKLSRCDWSEKDDVLGEAAVLCTHRRNNSRFKDRQHEDNPVAVFTEDDRMIKSSHMSFAYDRK